MKSCISGLDTSRAGGGYTTRKAKTRGQSLWKICKTVESWGDNIQRERIPIRGKNTKERNDNVEKTFWERKKVADS